MSRMRKNIGIISPFDKEFLLEESCVVPFVERSSASLIETLSKGGSITVFGDFGQFPDEMTQIDPSIDVHNMTAEKLFLTPILGSLSIGFSRIYDFKMLLLVFRDVSKITGRFFETISSKEKIADICKKSGFDLFYLTEEDQQDGNPSLGFHKTAVLPMITDPRILVQTVKSIHTGSYRLSQSAVARLMLNLGIRPKEIGE